MQAATTPSVWRFRVLLTTTKPNYSSFRFRHMSAIWWFKARPKNIIFYIFLTCLKYEFSWSHFSTMRWPKELLFRCSVVLLSTTKRHTISFWAPCMFEISSVKVDRISDAKILHRAYHTICEISSPCCGHLERCYLEVGSAIPYMRTPQ